MSRIGLLVGTAVLTVLLAPGAPALAQTMAPSQMESPQTGPSGTMQPTMEPRQTGPSRMGPMQTEPSPIQPPPAARARGREAMGLQTPVQPQGRTQQERRQLDNVANALNRCQGETEERRQACMRQAMEIRQ